MWTRRRELDLDCGFDTQVDDFAVLVLLKTDRIDYAPPRSKGEDLRFTTAADTPLDHEIERWVEDGVSIVRVRVPTINRAGPTHTKIRMYYGNPGADDVQNPRGIWKSTSEGVWHLSQADNALADSTGKSPLARNHGSTSGASIVGDGRSFVAASSQYIDTLNDVNVKRYTVEAFVKGKHDAMTWSGPNGALMRQRNHQIMWDHLNPFVAAASLNTNDTDATGQNWTASSGCPSSRPRLLAVMVSSTPPSTSLIAVAAPSTMFGQLAILPSGGVDEAEGASAAEDATPGEATGGGGGGGGNRTIEAMLLRGRETSFG